MTDYNDYGFPNEAPAHTMAYLLPKMLSLLDQRRNSCILDIGCGNGSLANMLIERGYDVYGTDASAEGIRIAAKKHPDRFFIQDLTTDELPYQLRQLTFDTIISTEVIEHLYDPHSFVAFCRRSLKPGGELIISTPYHGYLKNLLIGLFNKWDEHANPLWRGGHIKLWSVNTLTRLLSDSGFEVEAFEGCGRIPYLWSSMMIKAKAV